MDEATHILAGWLIDGSGGPVRERMLLRIVAGRFAAIEPYRPGLLAGDQPLTDLSHCTVVPPLVDCHVHLAMSGSTDPQVRAGQLAAGYAELRPVIGRHLGDLYGHGVLGVRDGGDRGGFALRFREEEEMIDELVLRVAGRAWHQKGRYGALIGRAPGPGGLVADYSGDFAAVDQVKLVNSGLNSLCDFGRTSDPQFTGEEIAALVKQAKRQGRRVMVHANGVEPVRLAVEGGCHSIEHGFFMGRDNLLRMADHGTYWVPTVYTMKAYHLHGPAADPTLDHRVIKQNLDHQLAQLATARELGVRVAIGTDAGSLGVLHGESMVEEMKLFRQAGYSLTETISSATSIGARLLAIDDFGLLGCGRPATFLVCRGTPGQLPRKLTYLEAIYQAGRPSPRYRKNPVKHPPGQGNLIVPRPPGNRPSG